jgi:hypothetical protein
MKAGWSPTQADKVMADEDAEKERKVQKQADDFTPVEQSTRTINRNSPLARLPAGEMERQRGEVYKKPKEEYSKTWFTDRLAAARRRAMIL